MNAVNVGVSASSVAMRASRRSSSACSRVRVSSVASARAAWIGSVASSASAKPAISKVRFMMQSPENRG